MSKLDRCGRPTININARIESDLHREFKRVCKLRTLKMSRVVEDLIIQWLKENSTVDTTF